MPGLPKTSTCSAPPRKWRSPPRGADGTLRLWASIWLVRTGHEIYVRSYRGTSGAWYRHASAQGRARIRPAGAEHVVTAEKPGVGSREDIDAAYREKYARYRTTTSSASSPPRRPRLPCGSSQGVCPTGSIIYYGLKLGSE
ncbi:DUF2255 family protein [Amycolatopsis acididurans]|uniref:DUF2255 family protein n=1 Tax=Amycolatopsis acididurans TaxID=2724524 RepID=UPI0035E4546C